MNIDTNILKNRNQNRSTVVCRNGIVCTSQPLASMAGIDILKSGGNAIDAAICANAVLSVVEPMSCGPGGDLFAIVWLERDKRLYGLNASGRSPFNLELSDFHDLGLKEIPLYGPLSWSVPGCVSGWEALRKKFANLNYDKLFEAAIDYAEDGFPVSPVISRSWEKVKSTEYLSLSETFAPGRQTPGFGEIFRNSGLVDFYGILLRDGIDSFYQGEIAERIVRFSEANGGRLSLKDFNEYTMEWIEPVTSNYRGYDIREIPPNCQGIAALQILNILDTFDIGSLKPNSVEHLHLLIEAKKLAYEDRAIYYADMDFAKIPLEELISKEYARARAALINPNRALSKLSAGDRMSDTIYLTAADKDGNMISLIQSIYHGFGSQMVPDKLGFALQNRGHLFSLNPNDFNKYEPHKRPFNTIMPGFVTRDGKPVFSFGVMGGDFQPQGQAQVLMNIIDFGMSPQQAGEQPRICHFGSSTPTGIKSSDGGRVGLERHLPENIKQGLEDLGHRILPDEGVYGGYQGIWREDNPLRYFGGSDPRKDGCSIGY
ncbi:MAG: gamma-glutamyltransferase family protein [candidate division Zixibacteria bacterium]